LLKPQMDVSDWRLDHLLVDQRGVLTFVEAKLRENRESRRQVIGQILEYAANAQEYWGNGLARKLASEYWRDKGTDVDDVLRAAFGEIDAEAFWAEVEANLRRGKVRLIIATDDLRPEVRRVIEYLNQQLKTVEVFGLEIRCFGDSPDSGVIVPFVIGQTQAAYDEKGRPPLKSWTPDELRRYYESQPDDNLRTRQLLDWAVQNDYFESATRQTPLFYLRRRSGQRIAAVYPTTVYVYLKEAVYAGGAQERDQLVGDLKAIGMYSPDLDPQVVADGRNLSRRQADLDDQELSSLQRVLARYCDAAPRE